MELNVNSPAYYSSHYGIDDAVNHYFQKAYLYFLDKEYSKKLKIVGISPIVAPEEIYVSGAWKESVNLIGNKSCAIISLKINFEEYHNADSFGKIELTKQLILNGLKKIKAKADFDYESFKKDLDNI